MQKKYEIDLEIYDQKSILEAIKDFKEIWDIKFKDWILTIDWDNDTSIQEIFNEFMNYLAWLMLS